MATRQEIRNAMASLGKQGLIALADDVEYGYERNQTIEQNIAMIMQFCEETGNTEWLEGRLGLPSNQDRELQFRATEVSAANRSARAAERSVVVSTVAVVIALIALVVAIRSCQNTAPTSVSSALIEKRPVAGKPNDRALPGGKDCQSIAG